MGKKTAFQKTLIGMPSQRTRTYHQDVFLITNTTHEHKYGPLFAAGHKILQKRQEFRFQNVAKNELSLDCKNINAQVKTGTDIPDIISAACERLKKGGRNREMDVSVYFKLQIVFKI